MGSFLITGGAGFIGSRLSKRLAMEGHEVSVFDNLHPQVHAKPEMIVSDLRRHGIAVEQGNVCDPAALSAALANSKAEMVFHLAAETGTGQSFDLPVRYCQVNVIGTATLVEAIRARGHAVGRVLLASSRAVYGEGACIDSDDRSALAAPRAAADMRAGNFGLWDRNGRPLTPVPTSSAYPPSPTSIYASTKLMQELVLRQAFFDTNVDVGILRLQNVYGPGQSLDNPYTGVLSIFSKQLLEGKQLTIYEDGGITRDFVYIDDVVSAFLKLVEVTPCPTEAIDIGSGVGATILSVARLMLDILGLDGRKIRVSGDFRSGDIRYAVADIHRARELIGWRVEVDLRKGLQALLQWSLEKEALA